MSHHYSIQKVRLKLNDPDKLKRTCFHVESAETWDQNTPVKGFHILQFFFVLTRG